MPSPKGQSETEQQILKELQIHNSDNYFPIFKTKVNKNVSTLNKRAIVITQKKILLNIKHKKVIYILHALINKKNHAFLIMTT